MSTEKRAVNLYFHPKDLEAIETFGPQKRTKSRVVALALAVLRLAPTELIDRARVELAKRDAA